VWLPEVVAPVSFAESLALVRECAACFVGALAEPPPKPMLVAVEESLRAGGAHGIHAVYVGPEGDFTPGELSALVGISTPVSFGASILRAETAAIYGVGVLKAFIDSNCA
jgi:16S rRNA U1498 N3-methylase RsmE